MGAENTELVIKTYRTESDALADTTPLFVNSSRSKLYTPNGADITGWEVLAQGESLGAGQNDIATVSFDATGANARIPIFTPAERAPIAILKADKKTVSSGINQLALMGMDNDFDGEQVTVYCSNSNRTNATVDITYHNLSTDTIQKANIKSRT